MSRGDRNRDGRLSRLWELIPASNAIAAIDLADGKQMLVVVDHDSWVLAAGAALPCVAAGRGSGLGCRTSDGGGVRRGDGGVRADDDDLDRPAFHRVPFLGASAVPDSALSGVELVPRCGIRIRPDVLLLLVDVVDSCRTSRLSGG